MKTNTRKNTGKRIKEKKNFLVAIFARRNLRRMKKKGDIALLTGEERGVDALCCCCALIFTLFFLQFFVQFQMIKNIICFFSSSLSVVPRSLYTIFFLATRQNQRNELTKTTNRKAKNGKEEMSVDDSKLTSGQELLEVVKLLHKCLAQHQSDSKERVQRQLFEDDEEVIRVRLMWQQAREMIQMERHEGEALKRLMPSSSASESTNNGNNQSSSSPTGSKVIDEIVPEEGTVVVPTSKQKDRIPAFWKVFEPERAPFQTRKVLCKHLKAIIQGSFTAGGSSQMVHSGALDEFFSVSYEYECVFRDVGVALLCLSFACNLCAHVSMRPYLDATVLVQWFLEIGLVFNALKRVVHLSLLGVANAAMCRDLRLTDDDAQRFATVICRLYGEHKVVEAWACAIINLVAGRQSANGAILLKKNIFEMLQRLLLLHGTEEATASRAMQALTVLSLCMFPPKHFHHHHRDPAAPASPTK